MRLIGWSAMRSRTYREVAFGIEAVELGGTEEAVDRGGTLAATIGAGEEPVLATQKRAGPKPKWLGPRDGWCSQVIAGDLRELAVLNRASWCQLQRAPRGFR